MATTTANLRGALAMSADSTDDGAGGAGEILHGAPTPGAAPTIGALRRVALAAGVSNEAADACLETQGPREALLSAIQLQSSTARSELAKRTPEAPPPAPEVYEVSVESELPAVVVASVSASTDATTFSQTVRGFLAVRRLASARQLLRAREALGIGSEQRVAYIR